MHTAEIFSKFGALDFKSITKLSPWWAADRGDNLRGVLHTAEIVSSMCCTPKIVSKVCCTPQRLTPWWKAHRPDNFAIEYLDEIKTEFENTLACLPGHQMGLNHEKNGDKKCRVTVPFRDDFYNFNLHTGICYYIKFCHPHW